MITEYHFPTPIYIKELPNAVQLNQYLEQQIIKWSQTDPEGKNRTNVNGWHSKTDMNRKEEYNVLTKDRHDKFMAGLKSKDHAILIAGNGYSFKGDNWRSSKKFDRIRIVQDNNIIEFYSYFLQGMLAICNEFLVYNDKADFTLIINLSTSILVLASA
mgnify:CR=1 FL=1